LKLRWFKKAFENFEKNTHGSGQSQFDAFARAESYWLEDYSLFLASRAKRALRIGPMAPRSANAPARRRYSGAEILCQGHTVSSVCSVAVSRQWKELKTYCTSKGIRLIGDVPLFVAHQSADVWAHPGLSNWMLLETPRWSREFRPIISPNRATVGLPVYRWEALQEQDYRWWIERLRTAFGRFDVIRLDHFIGFVRTYEVSAQAKTAVNGQYQPGGGASFFEAARKALGSLLLSRMISVQ